MATDSVLVLFQIRLLTLATDCCAISDEVVDIGYRLLCYF